MQEDLRVPSRGRRRLTQAQEPARPPRRRWLLLLGWAAAAVALFLCYVRVSQTQPADSYGAVFTLQAWDMLHGNLLLHGWWLSDVSFYTTELPEYMLVDLARGLSPGVVHVAAAITYTLLVLLTGLLAHGSGKGWPGRLAALAAMGIMLSPQPGNGVFVLLLAPDHVGTCVPVLLAWLAVDRLGRRWYVPAVAGALLAWALVADQIVLLIAVAPLVAVCAVRVCAHVVRGRPLRERWFELSLIAAGLAAAGAAAAALALISAHGGFVVWPVAPVLTGLTTMPQHLRLLVEGLLLLFGADFFGHGTGMGLAFGLVHLAGAGLAVWAVCAAVRRPRGAGLLGQVLAAGILINLAAFLLWERVGDITMAREMAAVLPYGAVLAGRLLSSRLAPARTGGATPAAAGEAAPGPAGRAAPARPLAALAALPALALVYLANLGYVAAHPPMPQQNHQLASWLAAHHLRYGIGTSWVGSDVTIASGGQVALRPMAWRGDGIGRSEWESNASWYDPRRHDATFAVLAGDPPRPALPPVQATFGPPVRSYHVGLYTVLVYRGNLLRRLH
jgi:hypothetical protein